MCCQKTFIMVYLILTNEFLLKTNQIKNIWLIISAQKRLGVNPNSLSYPFPLVLRVHVSKGCPNSGFDRGVG